MTLSGIRMVLFATPLLAVAAAWALPSTDVEAIPAAPAAVTADAIDLTINNCTYYNNANHSQIVGQFGRDCCNNPVAWGRKSRFYECGGCFPCVPPPE